MIKAFTRTGLFVFALTLIGAIQTQAQVIFTEDFETGIPGTWLTIDVDTLTPHANVAQFTSAWIGAADFSNATDTVAMSTSWYNPAGTSDDWLISPQIPLTAGNFLAWEEKAQDPAYADGYEVRISTTTPTIAGFMANAPLLTVPAASAGVWASQSVDLAAAGYLNQNVYLAWRNNSTDKYILVIDDILVAAGLLPDDVAAVNLYRGTQYTVVPSSQVQALMPNADMTNNVNGAATNPVMNIDISAGGVSQYNNSSTMGSLAGLTTANFAATAPFNTAVVDDYMVIAMASADITDTDPSNNFDTAFYSVSTDVYSRDNNVIVGALGIGNTASGFIGNDFEIVTATYISSLQFYLTSPMMGDTIIAAVYDQVSGTPSNEIASSVPYIITAADTNGVMLQLPIVNGNTALAAGTYTMGVQETFTSNITLAYGTSNYFPGTTWVFFDGTWSNSEDFGFNLAYIVRAVLGCPVPSASFTSSSVDLTATFTNTTSGTADGQFWDFGDGSGDTLQNPVHIYAAPGTYTVCLFAYNGCGLDTICDTVSVTVDLSCDNPTYYSEFNIQVDEATLIWNSVPNAIKYKLKIREVGTTTWTNHTIFSPDTIKVKGGLSPGTDYEYKIQTVCDLNSPTSYGPFQYFTTADACGNPATMTMQGVNPTQTNASWSAVTDAISYKLKYRPLGSNTWKYKTIVAPNTARNLYNLDPSTDYEFKIRTECSNGTVPYGPTEYFTTLNCDVAGNRNESSITPSSAILIWDSVPGASSYKVKYRVNNTSSWSYKNVNAPTTSTQLNSLYAGTTYQWKVKTFCSPVSNYSSYSGNNLFQTAAGVEGGEQSRLADVSDDRELNLYPNPNAGVFTVEMIGYESDAVINVLDMTGKLIYSDAVNASTEMRRVIDLNAAPGTYVLQLITDNSIDTRKLQVR